MSPPWFVKSGRWIFNPRRVIAVSQRDGIAPADGTNPARTLVVYDKGCEVELLGDEAIGVWRIFVGLVPPGYDADAPAVDEPRVTSVPGSRTVTLGYVVVMDDIANGADRVSE